MNTRFYYKHLENGGVITAAAIRDEQCYQHLGLAFCSPKDQFTKARARQISLGRANKNPILVKKGNATVEMKLLIDGLRGIKQADHSFGVKSIVPNWAV